MEGLIGTRREFLTGGALAFAQPAAQTRSTVSWSLVADGKIAVYSGRVDLGTGVRTALTRMAGEELDVPFESLWQSLDPEWRRA